MTNGEKLNKVKLMLGISNTDEDSLLSGYHDLAKELIIGHLCSVKTPSMPLFDVPPKYEAVYIGLDFACRDDLRARIDRRVDIMVEQGLLQEVQTLLGSGIPRTATALQAIGYKQFLAVEEGRATVEEAVEEVKLRSRQYAKRQLTWLRRNEAIHWIRWGKVPDFPEALQIATEILTAQGLS